MEAFLLVRPAMRFLALALLACTAAAAPLRVKDLGKVQGWRDNVLVGTGIVTGLAGTGDSPGNRATRQALSNVLSQFNLTVAPEQVNSRNVAVVMVSVQLPAFAREGDTLDVHVASSGDARSLLGGNLLLTALRAPNGRVYALAQGPVSIGGHRYDANGNVLQKNHPTAGSIPNGATVEVGMEAPQARSQVMFVLAEPDYTTASRIATAINTQLGGGLARARDAAGIEVQVPQSLRDEPVAFLARLESVLVEPDRRARVVINERTGTVVAGGDVQISPVSISHGDLKVTIATQNSVSQPSFLDRTGPGVVTAVVSNTQLDVAEPTGVGFLASAGTVSDLVQSLARMKTSTRDIISILRAVKAAGALHGDLVIQ
ncbi:MAG TPA: flagellar basal body P-ring protein FlgI [Ramlibacter sp.]|jgi:flagellar P-ring protein precursor FlgI|uniref:flagellar basal body P-ring protein FlgI n=1 Tax=Ramlibacter sp. TaxID=1917967 RepID=UPI002D4FA8F6|nr:flagellar basal body P-ring protein FlgI [Ramlibacter sp.]HZY20751.1 flagellar basal body P-ring protein FlgI [Ramlibacter sp.]